MSLLITIALTTPQTQASTTRMPAFHCLLECHSPLPNTSNLELPHEKIHSITGMAYMPRDLSPNFMFIINSQASTVASAPSLWRRPKLGLQIILHLFGFEGMLERPLYQPVWTCARS